VPGDAESASIFVDLFDGYDRAIYTKQLVGLHQLLDEAMLAFLEDDEVLDDVEEAGGTAGTFDQRIPCSTEDRVTAV
jgi:hypothetical protein